MTSLGNVLAYALPVVIAIAAIEGVILSLVVKRAYDWRASLASLADALGRQYIVYVYLPLSIAGPLIGWAWTHRIATMPLGTPAAFATLFLGQELCYYWFHRCSHLMRFFWATHAVHHSPNQLNLSAAYRFGLTGRLTGAGTFYVPLIWLGFPPGAVFATLSLNLLYQFWLHADWIPKLGWLEYVFNTPSHHRVHHAANPAYLDANYGGVLIVFDRLFGTYVAQRDDVRCDYGLISHPKSSHNILAINFEPWIGLLKDLRSARSPRDVWMYLFAPPGWRPDGEGLTTADIRRRAGLVPTASAQAAMT